MCQRSITFNKPVHSPGILHISIRLYVFASHLLFWWNLRKCFMENHWRKFIRASKYLEKFLMFNICLIAFLSCSLFIYRNKCKKTKQNHQYIYKSTNLYTLNGPGFKGILNYVLLLSFLLNQYVYIVLIVLITYDCLIIIWFYKSLPSKELLNAGTDSKLMALLKDLNYWLRVRIKILIRPWRACLYKMFS